jgi:hypothetical protein
MAGARHAFYPQQDWRRRSTLPAVALAAGSPRTRTEIWQTNVRQVPVELLFWSIGPGRKGTLIANGGHTLAPAGTAALFYNNGLVGRKAEFKKSQKPEGRTLAPAGTAAVFLVAMRSTAGNGFGLFNGLFLTLEIQSLFYLCIPVPWSILVVPA